MAVGDAAAAAGMDTVAGTDDLRNSYVEHNQTRDYLAAHQTGGTHSAAQITSGTLDVARVPLAQGLSKSTYTFSQVGTQWRASQDLGVLGNHIVNGVLTVGSTSALADVTASGPIDNLWARVNGISGGLALYAGASGRIGVSSSSRRFKQDEEDAELDRAALRHLIVKWFRYIELVEELGADAERDLFPIAEDAHDLGLTWLVVYDTEGRPSGINERRFLAASFWLAQDAQNRLSSLEADVAALKEANRG